MRAEDRPTRRRRSRWDRPPPPHDWRWVVGTVGKVLIATGLLLFGFVAYQLWGTGIEYARAQNELDAEFDELLAGADAPPPVATATVSTSAPATTTPTTTIAAAPDPGPTFQPGDVLARLEIPSIGLDTKVVQGVAPDDLQRGPGHYPDTPMPGQLGNAAIAGHRTTFGEPFADLDGVAIGDEVIVTTVDGRFVYRATASEVVPPSASEVIDTTDPTVATLTLTTCHPRWSASERLIVHADLDLAESPQPAIPEVAPTSTAPPTSPATATTTAAAVTAAVPATTQSTQSTPATPADAFAQGWFSDDEAFFHIALWGGLLIAIAVGASALSRATRRNWVGALAGIGPFVVVLYFFFQNVNRLLPAAL